MARSVGGRIPPARILASFLVRHSLFVLLAVLLLLGVATGTAIAADPIGSPLTGATNVGP